MSSNDTKNRCKNKKIWISLEKRKEIHTMFTFVDVWRCEKMSRLYHVQAVAYAV